MSQQCHWDKADNVQRLFSIYRAAQEDQHCLYAFHKLTFFSPSGGVETWLFREPLGKKTTLLAQGRAQIHNNVLMFAPSILLVSI